MPRGGIGKKLSNAQRFARIRRNLNDTRKNFGEIYYDSVNMHIDDIVEGLASGTPGHPHYPVPSPEAEGVLSTAWYVQEHTGADTVIQNVAMNQSGLYYGRFVNMGAPRGANQRHLGFFNRAVAETMGEGKGITEEIGNTILFRVKEEITK